MVRGNSRPFVWLAVLGALLLAAVEAQAQSRDHGREHGHHASGRRRAAAAPRRPPPPPSASLGWANSGTLVHGRRLEESDSVRFLPGRVLHWGTDEIVGLLERVAAAVHRRFGGRLTVGDLSAQQGGPVGRHRSHQSGRDADVCFLARTAPARGSGVPTDLDDYVSFDANGHSLDGRYTFDTARNWAVLEALLTDRRVTVERIFISAPLRQRLLAWAREHDVDSGLIDRAALTLLQPRGVSPHDNHFHVRIDCPDGDQKCREGVHRPRVVRRRPSRQSASTARGRAASAHDHARATTRSTPASPRRR